MIADTVLRSALQGASDALCPVRYAYDFQRAHPHSTLVTAPNAGHGADRDGAYKHLYAEVLQAI